MTDHPGARAPAACAGAVALLLLLHPAGVGAHWMRPDDIIAGLLLDRTLQTRVGLVDVYRDPDLPRLLILKVERARWDTVPAAARISLAEEWLETWRHNVPEGIVAVLDEATSDSVVNYDGAGHARLVEKPAHTPPP
jgi:hypothetical protein